MARFLQSQHDFPLRVNLGKKAPSWELNRWGRDGLRFVALEDGGYSVRGDKWTLHYTGEKQSHRFTILDGDHFEYDIILKKEPESNRLFLAIEGWEGFDFFRQPDTIGPEYLRGSYAVYKKETVINSPAYHVGTGKMCHIHRPKVIDARGRWVWGDVWIDKGVMALTIPEGWLGEAVYPVVVDPVIGSSTVGAYYTYKYMDNDNYQEYLDDKASDPGTQIDWYASDYAMELDVMMIFNKCKTPAQLNGAYNTYVYLQSIPLPSKYSSYTYTYRLFPILYTDLNNKPKLLLVHNSTVVSAAANLGSPNDFTPRWIQSTLTTHGAIAANTDVWFGFYGEMGCSRFDYGTPLFQTYGPGTFPFEDMRYYNTLYDMAPDYDFHDLGKYYDLYSNPYSYSQDPNRYPGARYDMKVSMYLGIPAAYTRTLTQGVKLTDTRKLTAAYVRKHTATVKGSDVISRVWGICRKLIMGVTASTTAGYWGAYYRTQKDTAGVEGIPLRSLGVFIKLVTVGFVRDFIVRRFLKSNEELVLKSKVCREIILDSKIH